MYLNLSSLCSECLISLPIFCIFLFPLLLLCLLSTLFAPPLQNTGMNHGWDKFVVLLFLFHAPSGFLPFSPLFSLLSCFHFWSSDKISSVMVFTQFLSLSDNFFFMTHLSYCFSIFFSSLLHTFNVVFPCSSHVVFYLVLFLPSMCLVLPVFSLTLSLFLC